MKRKEVNIMALEKMSDQFGGLPMESLIGGPLQAACKAQVMLAGATSSFIETVGFSKIDGKTEIRTVDFSFKRAVNIEGSDKIGTETVDMQVPLLSIVKIPALAVDTVDVTFDMEVKSSESSKDADDKSGAFDAKANVGIGPFSLNVNIKGAISSHKENTRSSDNSAKYHVQVHAAQGETPEGLSRVLDILNTAIAPTGVKEDQSTQPTTPPISPQNKLDQNGQRQ